MEEEGSDLVFVVDNGSYTIKAGIGGADDPRWCDVFPCITGCPKIKPAMVGSDWKSVYIGQEADARRDILNLSRPIERGIIEDWDGMEKIWHHAYYNQLQCVAPDPAPAVMHSEKAWNPNKNREKMAEIHFERFSSLQFSVQIDAVLSLYASGKTTGCVLDCGYEVTQAVPIYEGHALSHAVQRVDFGGRDLTKWCIKCLEESTRHTFSSKYERNHVCSIMQSESYVALDYDEELMNLKNGKLDEKEYEGFIDFTVKCGAAPFKCPESLFKLNSSPSPLFLKFIFDQALTYRKQPCLQCFDPPIFRRILDLSGTLPDGQRLWDGGVELFGPWPTCRGGKPIHKVCFDAIMKCDSEIREDLFSKIVCSGGSSMFVGFHERINKEFNALVPQTIATKVICPPKREYSTWIGGSILSSLGTFQPRWITKAEYNEFGPGIVNRKGF